jgi:uncharacterized iron-regulated membrane protein
VLAAHDARLAPRARSFVDALYSIHTGQFAEFPGRIFLVAVAAAFMALMIMGLRLWWLRRR